MEIRFTLNDEMAYIDAPPSTSLARVLRDEFTIRSLHEHCGRGFCGHCGVLVNGVSTPACQVPLFACRGAQIETIEGLITNQLFIDVEKGFLEAGLNPCPLCAGSKAVLAESLLRNNPELQREAVLAAIPQQWCSCSNIDSFVDGVMVAYDARRKRDKHGSSR